MAVTDDLDRYQGLRHDLLSPADERKFCYALVKARQQGDVQEVRRLKALLLRHNMRLVLQIAHRIPGLPLADRMQWGAMGFLHALDKYEPDRELKLSTYAVFWIRQHISRATSNLGSGIRVPVHLQNELRRVLRARERYRVLHAGREPTESQLVRLTKLPKGRVRACLRPLPWQDPLSLDAPVPSDEDGASYGSRVAGNTPDAEQVFLRAERDKVAKALFDELDERAKYVLGQRLQDTTLQEIGGILGISRERVRQIEAKALVRLRARVARLPARIEREWYGLLSPETGAARGPRQASLG